MKPILDRLRDNEVLVGDGAIGSLLMERGLRPGDCPDLMSVERPEVVAAIAGDYLAAGSDLLTTNTFGASPLKLADYGLESRVGEINRAAVATVREVAGDRAHVSASCGPSGALLEPYGDTPEEAVYESFVRQMRALAGADVVCIETMSDLREAILAVRAAKATLPDTPVMATMTFDATPRGFFTIMGNSIVDVCTGLDEAGADVLGSNCGNGIARMVEIARAFAAATALPLLIQSNAGKPTIEDGAVVYAESPEMFADKVPGLLDAGVRIIGGCCGTTPAHIRAMRHVVDARRGTAA
jgi:5-methyltetrahydrofolate--homocysteine methyltransferase